MNTSRKSCFLNHSFLLRVPKRGDEAMRMFTYYSLFALGAAGLLSLVVIIMDQVPQHYLPGHQYFHPAVGKR